MIIKKNDDGTFSIVSETTEVVKLEDLEAQLIDEKHWNEGILKLMDWRDKLTEQWQKDSIIITPLFNTELLELKINELKQLTNTNG